MLYKLVLLSTLIGCATVAATSPQEATAPTGTTPPASSALVQPACPDSLETAGIIAPVAPVAEVDASTRWQFRDALGKARKVHIERLRSYRNAKRFPRYKVEGEHRVFSFMQHRVVQSIGGAGPFKKRTDEERSPVFIDGEGTHCAVGYLMRESGWGEQAKAIAESDNHVLVERVTSGPLVDWILRSGLTQEEAAQIQPSYEEYLRAIEKRERKRLDRHFKEIERQLIENTEISLDIAVARIEPAIRVGLRVEAIGPAPAARAKL